MDVTPLIRRDTKVIQSYKDGHFKISGEVFTQPVIVMANRILVWPQSDIVVTADSFALLTNDTAEIEILLFGTGSKMHMLPHMTLRAVKERFGFSIDAMDTGAACRTYNVLMAEGRKVAAALFPFI